MARLLVKVLYMYRQQGRYRLHAFVVMPDHVHLLISVPPGVTVERAMQLVKGGFSYRAKKELGSNMEVWQKGFSDHRIRDTSDCRIHVDYTRQNPVRKNLCEKAEDYLYSSAHAGFDLDGLPQGLKPVGLGAVGGAPEGASFQSKSVRKATAIASQEIERKTS